MNFDLTQITYVGDVDPQFIQGQNSHKIDFDVKMEKQGKNNIRMTFINVLERFANGQSIYKIQVISIYTGFNIDLSNLKKESALLTTMIIQSFGHLQGILASKYQVAKVPGSPPLMPDIRPYIQKANNNFFFIVGEKPS